jgi:hypothetical protein
MKLFSWGVLAVMTVGLSSQPFSCFPRMKSTPSIKPYERPMPTEPRGTVPFAQDTASPVRVDTLATAAGPLPPTPVNTQTGAVYYTYYCQMCHGSEGKGDGNVGHSYVPTPPPLDTAAVQGMTEEQLVRAMLVGPGHELVLAHTVAPARRRYIAVYLRSRSRGVGRGHSPVVPTAGHTKVTATEGRRLVLRP